MKCFLLFSAIVFCAASAKCQSVIDLDKQNGYLDLTFDLPVDSVIQKLNAKLIDSGDNHFTFYDIDSSTYKNFDDHYIAYTTLAKYDTDSFYGFNFVFILFFKEEYEKLIALLTSLYGEPTRKNEILNTCDWIGTTTMIALRYDDKAKLTSMNLINLRVVDKIELREKLKQYLK